MLVVGPISKYHGEHHMECRSRPLRSADRGSNGEYESQSFNYYDQANSGQFRKEKGDIHESFLISNKKYSIKKKEKVKKFQLELENGFHRKMKDSSKEGMLWQQTNNIFSR